MQDSAVIVKIGQRAIPVARGEVLGEVMARAGADLPSDCGGKGICGKCLVRLWPAQAVSSPGEEERAVLSADQMASGLRLACQATVLGPLEVEPLREEQGSGQAGAYKSRLQGSFTVQHGLRRSSLLLGREGLAASGADGASLAVQLSWRVGETGLSLSPAACRQLSEAALSPGEVVAVLEKQEVLAVLRGGSTRSLGLAVDLGTTTLAVYLCDLGSGRIVASDSSLNPQRRFGEDVISRICAANETPSLTATMQQLTVAAINHLLDSVCDRAGCLTEEIDKVCLVGNPTMQTLFLGWNPASLGTAPYLPVTNQAQVLGSEALGLDLHPGARVQVFPVVAGFIGGDALAVALCLEQGKYQGPVLALDLGTNGELFLLNEGKVWAASAATGPAFEGANIERGMRAAPGAVDRVYWDQDTACFACRLSPGLGPEGKALGICGSGLIDAVAVLLERGVIDATGRLQAGKPGVATDDQGGAWAVELLPAAACADGHPLYLTQNDIRQVQLAKAALRVGLEYLLEAAGCPTVAHTIITGAFGAGFHWPSAARLGMLPDRRLLGTIETVENAAGMGAVMALLDEGKNRRANELAGLVRVVELNQQADFNDRFIQALGFPPVSEA